MLNISIINNSISLDGIIFLYKIARVDRSRIKPTQGWVIVFVRLLICLHTYAIALLKSQLKSYSIYWGLYSLIVCCWYHTTAKIT